MLGVAPDPFAVAADILDPPPDEDREVALACQASLSRYVREAWPIVEPAEPFIHGWHIDVICEHLEAVSRGELPRLLVNVPPRSMKSLTTCVFWPSWEWLSKPSIRWLFASYAEDFAHRDSLKMRRLVRSEGGRDEGMIFQRLGYQGVLRLLGEEEPWGLTKDQDAKRRYDNTEAGMRMATGVRGQATGEGGDRIVVDDPLSAKQARSEADRKFVNTWWSETMSTRFNNDRATAVIVMQRLHEQDLTGYLLDRGGWHHLCLPGEYIPNHQFTYPAEAKLASGETLPGDRRTEEGELLDPVRLGPEKLKELAKELGSYGYAGQIQQRPSPEEGGMFKRGWWQRWEAHPPFERVIASWDMRFSDSQEAASSYVVGQVWGVVGADRFLLGQIRAKLSFTESLQGVRDLEKWRHCTTKLVEEKANGAAVINTLKKKVPGLLPINPEGGKEARAAAVESTVEAGNVYLPDEEYIPAPPGYEPTLVAKFIEEFATFPNGSHDDQVDAMSQALTWLENAPGPASSTKKHPWR